MTGIYAYKGIRSSELNQVRLTENGKPYTLNHPASLVAAMAFKGEQTNANAQGWHRSCGVFFKGLKDRHPEYFSARNSKAVDAGRMPKVDARFASFFPQYEAYKNETLVHHHIGGDGQAVAVPQSIHPGYGGIHQVEEELGIRGQARDFSRQCQNASQLDPAVLGMSADDLNGLMARQTSEAIRMDEAAAKAAAAEETEAAVKAAAAEETEAENQYADAGGYADQDIAEGMAYSL